jgi:2'-5' RNA ligase
MLQSSVSGAEARPVNSFALVSYIPGPLGRFLDETRRELEPHSLAPRAHVTLLPPRSLEVDPGVARSHLEGALEDVPAIEIVLGAIQVFPVTNVVYVAVDGGFRQLKMLHERLNSGPLSFSEPFHYHPHVTLAQGLTSEHAETVRREAARRWEKFAGPRNFSTEAFSFVQADSAKRWTDLEEYSLAPALRLR